MNKRILLITAILIATLAVGCTNINEKDIVQTSIELKEVVEGGSIIYQNDNIRIKISNKIEEPEEVYKRILKELEIIEGFSPIENIEIEISKQFIVPNLDGKIKCDGKYIETEDFKKELIKKSYGIYDNWISEGVYAKIYNIENSQIDFSAYYKDNEFSLFGARFFEPFSSKEEVDAIKSASVDLVEYLLKDNKKEELLKNEIYIEDIEKWAKDKDIDLTYQKEIEYLVSPMEVIRSNPNIYLTMNTKEEINGFKIDILTMGEQWDTAKKLEEFLLIMDENISDIREGIKRDAPNFYKEYSVVMENVPKIQYFLDINSVASLAEFGRGGIILRSLLSQAHEYVHILMVDSFKANGVDINKPVWLDEGLANYLYVAYTKSSKRNTEKKTEEMLTLEESGYKLTNEEKALHYSLLEIFSSNDIKLENLSKILESKENRIKISTIIEIAGGKIGGRVSEGLEEGTVFPKGSSFTNQKSWHMGKGNYIDYFRNRDFNNYLVHEYGLEKMLYLMLEDFSNLTYEEYFGKGYEELKADWIEYLKQNIKAIDLLL